jgi:hypothetical protein
MIHYQLRCSAEHGFDGWFRDSAAFDDQAKRGLLSCPACGGTDIARALMAPAVGRGHAAPAQVAVALENAAETAPAVPQPAVGGALPDQVRAALQRLRSEVEKRCENVGDRFAEEARLIHSGDSPARGIYGEATPEQAESLAEDGIDVARIPWLPRSDS